MAKTKTPAEIVGRVTSDFADDNKAWDTFITNVDRQYRSYRGVLEQRSQAAKWTNKQHPAYVFQSIETIVANLLDPAPKWRLRALPVSSTPDAIQTMRDGALANERLLNHQLSCDHFAEKQRVIDLQCLIAGLTVTKQRWNYRTGTVRRRVPDQQEVHDDYGNVIGTVPIMRETSSEETLADDPTCDPVDVRDFIPHEGAISLAKCQRVTHRLWYTFDELKQLEKMGLYENVDELNASKDQTQQAGLYNRESDLFSVDKTKGMIEVLEQWRVDPTAPGGMRVVSVGNKNVLLRDRPTPFYFDYLEHQYPFMVCSGTPDLFRIAGISEVEMMAEIQEMLWTLVNQRLDSTQLINNAIIMVDENTEDPDSFEFAPGARWLVSHPDQVKMFAPDIAIVDVSLQAEALLKGDLQNVTGGMPFMSGTQTQSVDQNTATGVSIVTNLAQRRLAAKKQQFTWAKRRIGEQWCALNQQFITEPRLVPTIGVRGAADFLEVRPDLLQGRYFFETELAEESLIQQQQRAEAQAKLQTALSAAQYFAAIPGQRALNLEAFMDDYLDAFGVDEKDRYYAPETASQPIPQAQPGQQGQEAQQGAPQGVTAASASDALSPSNVESMSPAVFTQRQGAMLGGPVNG